MRYADQDGMAFSFTPKPAPVAGALLFLSIAAITQAHSNEESPKETFQRVCFDCHGIGMVDGKHYSRDVWQETVLQMVRRGARASEDDVQTIIDYLAETYPPSKVLINKESASDLQLDLLLTSKAAAAIVHYREEHGDFKSIDDLAKVPELDPAIIQRNKDRFVF